MSKWTSFTGLTEFAPNLLLLLVIAKFEWFCACSKGCLFAQIILLLSVIVKFEQMNMFYQHHKICSNFTIEISKRKIWANYVWLVRHIHSRGWKPTHLTSVFSLLTSIFTSPHGTTLKAYGCPYTDVRGCQMGWFPPTPFIPL